MVKFLVKIVLFDFKLGLRLKIMRACQGGSHSPFLESCFFLRNRGTEEGTHIEERFIVIPDDE